MTSLLNVDPSPGRPYARYAHLLGSHEDLVVKKDKVKIVNLLDRVHLMGGETEAFLWMRRARRARMTAEARAHLRMKLAVHFGRVEEDSDLPLLRAAGLDDFGRPVPQNAVGFPE